MNFININIIIAIQQNNSIVNSTKAYIKGQRQVFNYT